MRTIFDFRMLCLAFFTMNCCSGGQSMNADEYYQLRKTMTEQQIKNRGITNKKVLDAMMEVPRHLFVPENYRKHAYEDSPLPIGYDQTISQPYIVAYMTEILDPQPEQKILEIGTGSGYQAAILSKLYKEVYTIEIVDELGLQSQQVFKEQNYNNIVVKIGDGYKGWAEHAPFHAIIVTCAPDNIPQPLVDQLAEGGKMIIPVGDRNSQILYLLEKRKGKVHKKETLPVLFVPMIREE